MVGVVNVSHYLEKRDLALLVIDNVVMEDLED